VILTRDVPQNNEKSCTDTIFETKGSPIANYAYYEDTLHWELSALPFSDALTAEWQKQTLHP